MQNKADCVNFLRSKKAKMFLIMFLLLLFICSNVFATTLNIGVTTDKNKYNKGEKVNVTVNWTPEMQAAGFSLKYDSSKLRFDSASIESSFYNSDTKGKISVNWASFEEKNTKSISFSFTTISEGDCTIQVYDPNSFATGDLEMPDKYEYISNGIKKITIEKNGENSGTVVQPDNEQPKSNITDEEEYEELEEEEEENTNSGNSTGNESNQGKNNTNNNSNSSTNSNSSSNSGTGTGTSSANNFPKTGLTTAIPTAITILIVLTIFSYKKYKNLSGI